MTQDNFSFARGYKELNALPPNAFLKPEDFRTSLDNHPEHIKNKYGEAQYKKGLEIGRKAKSISIGAAGVWAADLNNGSSLSSYEGIGYHACTADLLRGFLDSGAPIFVYRWQGNKIVETRIK